MKIARKLVSVLLVIAVLSALPLALSAAALRDMGDVNGADGVTAVDYLMIKRHVLKSFEIDDMWGYLSADINHDGEINAVDYLMVKRAVLNSFTIDEYVDDPSHCFLNENNNTFDVDKDLDKILIKPKYVYWQDGNLVMQCFLMNTYSYKVSSIYINKVRLYNPEVMIAYCDFTGNEGYLGNVSLNAFSHTEITLTIYPSGILAYGASLENLTVYHECSCTVHN